MIAWCGGASFRRHVAAAYQGTSREMIPIKPPRAALPPRAATTDSTMSAEEVRRRIGASSSYALSNERVVVVVAASSSSSSRPPPPGAATWGGILCEAYYSPPGGGGGVPLPNDDGAPSGMIADQAVHAGSLAASLAFDPSCRGGAYYVPCSVSSEPACDDDDHAPWDAARFSFGGGGGGGGYGVDGMVFNGAGVETNEILADLGDDDDLFWGGDFPFFGDDALDYGGDGMVFNGAGVETNEILADLGDDRFVTRDATTMLFYARASRFDAASASSDVYVLPPAASSAAKGGGVSFRRAWKFVVEYKIATINIGSIPGFGVGGGATMPLLRRPGLDRPR
jgi:hypothetical protein